MNVKRHESEPGIGVKVRAFRALFVGLFRFDGVIVKVSNSMGRKVRPG